MNWLVSLIDYGIVGVLVVLSILVVTLATERILFVRNIDLNDYPSRHLLELHLSKNMSVIGTVAGNTP